MTKNALATGQVESLENRNTLSLWRLARRPQQWARLASAVMPLLLWPATVSATPYFFSTGDPDGKIATLSRPASPGVLQMETADDFILSENTLITQATFVGLLPSGAPLSSISQVEVEIYHVFPKDSVFPPSGNVPMRANSPADVEIDSATRDSLNGSLSYMASLISPAFTATNSVVNGIHRSPDQTTHGENQVTGDEVAITVFFRPPISLPADHYFFRPEVRLTSGEFLWLSAPKPIVAPGTPLTLDLQTWIRNDSLAPDWLRIGTDITLRGPFNGAFSLTGETDADADGVPDLVDLCPDTLAGAAVDATGCSIDQIAPCNGPSSGETWKNHGQYVSAVAHAATAFLEQGLISEAQAGEILAQAALSDCGSAHR